MSWPWRERLLVLILGLISAVQSQELVAKLDYGVFQGAYSKEYNISYWQKIPFAAPPVGENRFRAPQPPRPITNGVYNSSQTFDMCPQRTVNGSEDCLYLGVYSRPWEKGQPLRPVVVVFYGGGFIQGSASFTLPPSAYPVLNVSATTDLVFIYTNYRVNAFGLLPGRAVVDDPHSDTNVGLLDQRAAIYWANKYAAQFGGDPDNVAIWGQSAGGGSVVSQVIGDHDFDRSCPRGTGTGARFRKALASSPFWPKTYSATSPEAEWIYDTMVNRTGCRDAEGGSLACLKRADVQTIRDASLYVASSHTYNTSSYTWAPVIDGKFLKRSLVEAAAGPDKKVNIEVGFGMYNTHEGENFLPGGLSTLEGYDAWLKGFLPGLGSKDLDDVKAVYPVVGTTETLSYNSSTTAASLVFRDVVLACPAFWMAGAAPRGSWLGEYTIAPAKHASDTTWWNTLNSVQKTDPFHYQGYTGTFASFFQTGDPNAQKLTNSSIPGVPPLSSSQEFVINEEGFAHADLAQLKRRCSLWQKLGPRIPI